MKTCTMCGKSKDKSLFGRHATTRDRLDQWCKPCRAKYKKDYRLRNKEAIAKKDRDYRERNAEKLANRVRFPTKESREKERKRQKEYDLAHRDHHNQKMAEYYQLNREELLLKYEAYRKANPVAVAACITAWRKAHPELTRVHVQNSRAKSRGIEGKLSPDIVFIKFAEQHGLCACCGDPLDEQTDIDHRIPFHRKGPNTDDNIQLVHSRCNARKGTRPHDEFVERLRNEMA